MLVDPLGARSPRHSWHRHWKPGTRSGLLRLRLSHADGLPTSCRSGVERGSSQPQGSGWCWVSSGRAVTGPRAASASPKPTSASLSAGSPLTMTTNLNCLADCSLGRHWEAFSRANVRPGPHNWFAHWPCGRAHYVSQCAGQANNPRSHAQSKMWGMECGQRIILAITTIAKIYRSARLATVIQ